MVLRRCAVAPSRASRWKFGIAPSASKRSTSSGESPSKPRRNTGPGAAGGRDRGAQPTSAAARAQAAPRANGDFMGGSGGSRGGGSSPGILEDPPGPHKVPGGGERAAGQNDPEEREGRAQHERMR